MEHFDKTRSEQGTAARPEQSSRVVGELLTLIEQRQYLPGERLPSERDLAERFSVGRATVREAVTTLESMRYLERRPGSGIFRAKQPDSASVETLVLFSELGLPLDAKTNADVVEVRRMIEVQAIELACERRGAEDIARLEAVLERFRDDESFASAASSYDQDFHLEVFRATHNDVLVRLVTPLYIMAKTRRVVFFKDAQRRRVSHSQHVAMLKAIRAQERQKAADLMTRHIGRVEKYFTDR